MGCDFPYLRELDNFCGRVNQDVGNIKLLFPEYTLHDEQHHLKPLFHLGGELLGNRLIRQLSATELFILVCSLYGHDWGMAVSTAEKQRILGIQPQSDNDSSIPSDEPIQFREYAQNQGYRKIDVSDIPIGLWCQYVRDTHADRSYYRVIKHFETVNVGVAYSVARICRSHCLSIEELRDPDMYPIQYSVLGEVVNMRALAVYLRLIDLFDLADNRTPYAIWKHVAPRDPTSVMEWDKHRALRQITFAPYQAGQRRILVNGSTNDHEVYAALLDLRDYCQTQFRACIDLIAEIPDKKYALNLSHIDWKVEAEGFEPISIQFQFDRERMLQFMTEELYKKNDMVFLRELLQNSIDAIRMRRAVIESKEDRSIVFRGEIRVRVRHKLNGGIDIEWNDNGIGMDQDIIRNYLAVAGKSYYQSRDFQRLGLSMDPISRFGIGILTCFMFTDRIEIITKRDANVSRVSSPLRIDIPDVRRYFRVEVLKDKGVETGTTIKLSVSPTKIDPNIWSLSDPPPRTIVINYLRRIAGFVEFPIIIEEDQHKAVILHPYSDRNEAQRRFGDDYRIIQLELKFPWDDAFFPQDLSLAHDIFREELFDIQADLGLADYEGILGYLVPLEKGMDFTGAPQHVPGIKVLSSGQRNLVDRSIRYMPEWIQRFDPGRQSNEVKQRGRNIVYRDGILLSEASIDLPFRTRRWHNQVSDTVHLVVNLPKTRAKDVDFARTRVLTHSSKWANPIFDAHVKVLKENFHALDFMEMAPAQRLFQLASFMLFHNSSVEDLARIFPRDNWPLPVLNRGGYLSFRLWSEIRDNTIYRAPDPLSYILADLMANMRIDVSPPKPLHLWQGNPSIVDFATWGGSNGDSIIVNTILEFARLPFQISHRFGGIQFLMPPWHGAPPLLQEIWIPNRLDYEESKADIEKKIVEIAQKPENSILAKDGNVQRRIFQLLGMEGYHPKLAIFPPPYEDSFAYGDEVINLTHPISKSLVCIAAGLALEETAGQPLISKNEHFRYVFRRVILGLPGGVGAGKYNDWKRYTEDLWAMVKLMRLSDVMQVDNLTPGSEEFVSGSCERWLLHVKVNENWSSPFGTTLR